jgi:signal transduction histidine kinase
MSDVAMTLMAPTSEPSPHEAHSHAIKNCLSVIVGLASTVEPHVDPVARPRVTQLVDASRRLKELLARPSRPSARVRKEVCIAELLQVVVDRLAPQAEACVIECAGGTLVGDLGELAEALYNLGSNALYASPPDSTIRVTTRRTADGDHEWSVEDAGCGIPACVMSRLGTVGVTTRAEGTGLGLSLALQVITRHEGLMHIASIGGHGTTVTIWLPGRSRNHG